MKRGPGSVARYSDWLRTGQSGDRIPVGVRFSALVQTGPGAHPASCTLGTGSFPGVKGARGVTPTPHPLLVPWSRKGRVIIVISLWAIQPVQSLSACTRVHFTLLYMQHKLTDCSLMSNTLFIFGNIISTNSYLIITSP
jgi:hypothetical protein